MMRRLATLGCMATIVASLTSSNVFARSDDASAPVGIASPKQPTPILGLDELKRGMRGYGLTAFEGDEPEPFTFEVVAVIGNTTPGRSVIWVRCTDERLSFSGPVQGMSGSPMYVWTEGGPHQPGEGGKLIGAFAFGYSFSKQPYIGVQPIEYMRRLTGEAVRMDADAAKPNAASNGHTLRVLDALTEQTRANSLASKQLQLARRLLTPSRGGTSTVAGTPRSRAASHTPRASDPRRVRGWQEDRWGQAMQLPIDVGSVEAARFAEPLLRPMGLRPVAGGGGGGVAMSTRTSEGSDAGVKAEEGEEGEKGEGKERHENAPAADRTTLRPGTPLSVPLIMGDWDAAATGTVTDVLPDGSVLGFGHPMMGMGATAMPMATGEVHFVMPRQDISFKQSSSRRVVGTLRRDAAAGVVGGPGVDFDTAAVRVTVDQVGVEQKRYAYEVVEVPGSTATFAAVAAIQSLTAVQGSPMDSTTRMRATLRFAGDRELTLDTLAPQANPGMLARTLMMPMALMTTNRFESTRLVSADVRFEVEPAVRSATITDATLQKAAVAPGERASVVVTLQPYGEAAVRETIELRIPPGTPEGNYMLTVGDAQTFLGMTLGNRPHRLDPSNADELQRMLQRIVGVQSDAVYLVLQLPGTSVAVGAAEMPQLPSSRAAILATPTSSRATRYNETVEATTDTPFATVGQRSFVVSVRDPAGEAKAGDEK